MTIATCWNCRKKAEITDNRALCDICAIEIDKSSKALSEPLKNDFTDIDIEKVIGIDDEEKDSSVGYYQPFCLILEDDKKHRLQLYLDYDRLMDLAHLLKPYLDEEQAQIQNEKECEE